MKTRFGGVPLIVAIPPMLAAKAIHNIRPLTISSSDFVNFSSVSNLKAKFIKNV